MASSALQMLVKANFQHILLLYLSVFSFILQVSKCRGLSVHTDYCNLKMCEAHLQKVVLEGYGTGQYIFIDAQLFYSLHGFAVVEFIEFQNRNT